MADDVHASALAPAPGSSPVLDRSPVLDLDTPATRALAGTSLRRSSRTQRCEVRGRVVLGDGRRG